MKPLTSFGLKTLTILGASVALGLAFNASRPAPPSPLDQPVAPIQAAQSGDITLAEASRLFTAGEAVFADARDNVTYAAGHIQGALSLPAYELDTMLPPLRERLTGKTVIAYCDGEHCELSHELAQQLRAKGITPVLVLKNGWTVWKEAGLPTESTVSPAQIGEKLQELLTPGAPGAATPSEPAVNAPAEPASSIPTAPADSVPTAPAAEPAPETPAAPDNATLGHMETQPGTADAPTAEPASLSTPEPPVQAAVPDVPAPGNQSSDAPDSASLSAATAAQDNGTQPTEQKP